MRFQVHYSQPPDSSAVRLTTLHARHVYAALEKALNWKTRRAILRILATKPGGESWECIGVMAPISGGPGSRTKAAPPK
jgi:hypothetical protein